MVAPGVAAAAAAAAGVVRGVAVGVGARCLGAARAAPRAVGAPLEVWVTTVERGAAVGRCRCLFCFRWAVASALVGRSADTARR